MSVITKWGEKCENSHKSGVMKQNKDPWEETRKKPAVKMMRDQESEPSDPLMSLRATGPCCLLLCEDDSSVTLRPLRER